ncbi:MAG: NUDIX domain-containing protein [Candidatus Krumholzibacteriota bacterium]|nr:NUDIX domain-containing protein [Candidatus Krumholzibacteriota bacterium]
MQDRMIFCPYCGNRLTSKKNEGRTRLYCKPGERYVYQNPIPAATGLIFDENGRILLVLRARNPGKNKWCLPGGFVETDEAPVKAAKREVFEETSIIASKPALIDIEFQESIFYKTSIMIIGYHFAEYSGELTAGDDAENAGFFAPEDLPKLAFTSHMKLIEKFIRAKVDSS